MRSKRSMKNKNTKIKTRKQFDKIQKAVSRAEGRQSLDRFGHAGEDKFIEEQNQHDWLYHLGPKKDLQPYINQHYYKYDSKKVNLNVRQPSTFLYPKLKTRRNKH